VKGIDISAWQENIDWQAVKDAGIGFVIIKLGESEYLDSMFIEHANNAVAADLKIGVYYYARATSEAEAQQEADWVGAQIKQYLNGANPEMGIWYDMEDPSIADSGADITALCGAFVNQMTSAGYTFVGVYSSYDWLTNKIDTAQLTVQYWCAQYNSECDFTSPSLKLWQYTDSLNIGGINFDGNEYYA